MEGIVNEFFDLVDKRASESIKIAEWNRKNEARNEGIFHEVLLEISDTALRPLLTNRAKFHKNKADFYLKQARAIKADAEEQSMKMSNSYSTGDPVGDMERQSREHEHTAAKFNIMAAHLRSGTYHLDMHTMTQLELDKAN